VAKKHKHEEHENHERWLVSYADFMTLLFAFFVVMYAVSRVDNKRIIQATESIRWAMHFSGTGGTGALPIFDGPPTEGGGPALRSGKVQQPDQQKEAIEMLRKKLEKRVRPFVMERNNKPVVSVVVEGRKLTVRMAATEFFDPGQAVLRPQSLPILDAVAGELIPIQRLSASRGTPTRPRSETPRSATTGSSRRPAPRRWSPTSRRRTRAAPSSSPPWGSARPAPW
jgi:chemotaxis protein MotB